MASVQAKLVNRYLRNTMKKLPLAEMEPTKIREVFEKRVIPFLPKSVERESVSGEVSGEWQRPQNAKNGRTILFCHGGGYVFGSPRTHRSMSYPLAVAGAADVFSLDYRLAPENPCPAQIEDALLAYDMLIEQGRDPKSIWIAGDSAGGGLTLSTMLALRDRGGPQPAGGITYSPWTDMTCSGASMSENIGSDVMFQISSIHGGAERYIGELPADDPRASPLFADLEGMAPVLVFASNSEVLRDDGIRFAERAREAGVDAELIVEEGLAHVWPLFNPLIPEAKKAVNQSAAFIERTAP